MTPTTPKPRIGIVGAGIRGSLFAQALSQHGDVDVVAIADPTPAAQHVADTLGIDAYASLEAMLADASLTAAVVATPDFAHRAPAVAAAEAGLDLLIEKPLATTTEDARAIAQAASRGGGRVMVGFENRWNPRFIAARTALADTVGSVRHQVVHLHDTRFVPTTMLRWAAQSSPAWFLMPHTLDLALWLTGRRVARVQAIGTRGVLERDGVDTWDSIDAFVEHDDGSTTTLHSAWVLPESYPAVYDLRYEAIGDRGAVRVSGSDQGVHVFGVRGDWAQWGVYEFNGALRGFPVDMATTFGDLLCGADIDVPGLAEGLEITRVIEAIHQSLESRAPVDLD